MSDRSFTLKSEDFVCPSYFAMSVHMRRNVHLLKVLHQAKPKLRKAMLKHLEPSCIKAICDCVLNILKSVVKMSPVQKRKLARHKDHLIKGACQERYTIEKATANDCSKRGRLSYFSDGTCFKRTSVAHRIEA
jgi:hypothetical protein